MIIKQKAGEIEKSNKFISWREKNKESFISHVFLSNDDFQVGYYNSKTKKITTFLAEKNEIKIIENQEVLMAEKEIKKLDLNKINLSPEEALKKAENKVKENIGRTFIILQNIDDKNIFNITFFTVNQNLINIKINAENSEIIHQEATKLSDFYKVTTQ